MRHNPWDKACSAAYDDYPYEVDARCYICRPIVEIALPADKRDDRGQRSHRDIDLDIKALPKVESVLEALLKDGFPLKAEVGGAIRCLARLARDTAYAFSAPEAVDSTGVDQTEVFEEWRVTGEPGGSFPPYSFTFGSPTRRSMREDADPEAEARSFAALARVVKWANGPYLHRRTVTYSPWVEGDTK